MTEEYRRGFLDSTPTVRYAEELADRLATSWSTSAAAELGEFDDLLEKNLAQLDELQVLLDTVRCCL